MYLRVFYSTFVACLFQIAIVSPSPAADAKLPDPANHSVDFAREIKPLFEAACVQCHAKGKDKGGFSLENRAALLKGGDTGPAAVIGKSGGSLIVNLVAGTDPDAVMPKKGSKWTPDQVGLLRAWIDQGMSWDESITFARPQPANLVRRAVELPKGDAAHPIDRILSAYFVTKSQTPADLVDDHIFARRVYLDTIGLLPTTAQLDEFLADMSPDKRSRLAAKLLSDRRGYAENWLTFWNDLLRNDYRGAGYIDGGRRQISGWLYSALVNNIPYDRFVRELVNPTAASEGFSRGIIWRGSVSASMLPPMQAAQNVAQVFMGVNLKCASCHDSFVNDWTLSDAYGLAAIYSDESLELVHCDKPTGKQAAVRFLYPQVGDLNPSDDRPARLQKLAELMTGERNGRLSRTIVNRLWAKLLGRGLVEPLDDMDRPAWSADLLDWLSEDLIAHNYDVKHTIELILTSSAYQMPAVESSEEKGEFTFGGPIIRRLTAEQYCDALSTFSDDWPRMPVTIDFDFSAGDLVKVKNASWVWTDESVEDGQNRAFELAKKNLAAAAKVAATGKKKSKKTKAAGAAPTSIEPEAKEKKKDATKSVAVEPADSADKPDTAQKSENGEKSKPAEKADTAPKSDPVETKAGDSLADKSTSSDKDAAKPPVKVVPPARHRVAFRKTFELEKVPQEAFASVSASQGTVLMVNGKVARAVLSDGRTGVYDVRELLIAGKNLVVLDVNSHTEKKLSPLEFDQFPKSQNHLNAVSGVGFYLRARFLDEVPVEVTTDATWHARRAPDDGYRTVKFDDSTWRTAVVLPGGVEPVDEGPTLPPVRRKDFASEPVHLDRPFRSAATTAAQPGTIRAAMLAADPLMVALDRPNREIVISARGTAATTLQALALTNGSALDARLKRAAEHLAPEIARDVAGSVREIYRHALSRDPTEAESKITAELLGESVKPEAVADFLWALTQLPEFQFIR